ncbi:helicase [Mucilaginibacter conchicola]|uniref:Helicase n=1 Tax=Mucilaginibacter conchicola TaxID=2303333 RepID=A0A372NV98_9SPHI|nr:HRDC domain-containing protein [Mucilaginibacter conchicola]RFZ94046.1 helicase [Mucilaginibacter conchicola]
MDNPSISLAQAYVDYTNTLVFLTGKAGTGKTTFLRKIRQSSTKKMVIVAPTGVAAINAGGMTIHSLFQLPFGPLLPEQTDRPETKYNAEKRELLRSLELLIIDEISMVRPDVLDQVDLILRNIRGNKHAFGGVQLLLIGDLAQLSPIIREEEWSLLRPYYSTPYFFSSLVLQQTDYVRVELDKVYRQSDPTFVGILNAMRDQQLTEQDLTRLNTRFIRGFMADVGEGYITLTTHNRIAQSINAGHLEALPGAETVYKATIRGEFPADAYPTETTLSLKVGAQVMFVKNDNSPEKRYYNGKIGRVIDLEPAAVLVATPDGLEIRVEALEWTNVKYELGGDDGINENNAGSFAQIPLKPAWAITIHKSQGLTFDKAVIDVSEAFTHGQAYVALSRCRSLEGLVLSNPVSARNVIADPVVNRFNLEAKNREPNFDTLEKHKEAYRLFLLSELFNFSGLKETLSKFKALLPGGGDEIFNVADKMKLSQYTDERIQKAAIFFSDKLETMLAGLYVSLSGYVGTSKELAAQADKLMHWLVNRLWLLKAFSDQTFTTDDYLRISLQKQTPEQSLLKALNAKPNEALYERLIEWRETTAQTEGVLASMLFSEQTLAAIAARLPATLKTLSGVKGVGPEKVTRYGAKLITLIRAYQQELSGGDDQASLF